VIDPSTTTCQIVHVFELLADSSADHRCGQGSLPNAAQAVGCGRLRQTRAVGRPARSVEGHAGPGGVGFGARARGPIRGLRRGVCDVVHRVVGWFACVGSACDARCGSGRRCGCGCVGGSGVDGGFVVVVGCWGSSRGDREYGRDQGSGCSRNVAVLLVLAALVFFAS
jgi:hypothetical protein